MLTARVTSGPRISMVASTPSTTTPSGPTVELEVGDDAGHLLGLGRVDAAAQRGEGDRPVHGAGVEVLEPEAGGQRRATVDLPEPAGPSMAITLTSAWTLPGRPAAASQPSSMAQ